jgi:C1A family cysteine protease/fibronectin type 3 domain-containing protein
MKKIKQERFHRPLWLTLLFFIVASPAFTEKPFDPKSVQSRQCQEGQFQCGFTPPAAEVEESIPPADSVMISHRGLPSRVDLSADMPPVVNQGQQNSCVAFSVGYYTRSYFEKKARGWSYDSPPYGGEGEHVFSPAFIYNQINGGQDSGSYFHHALDLVTRKGAAPWKMMPYNAQDYRTQPSEAAKTSALQYKAASYRRIPFDNIQAVKAELAAGRPVIFGIVVDDAFYNLGTKVYDQPKGRSYGGHAMTLVGYDDSKTSPKGDRGAFKLINSWGREWGENGYGWISYRQWLAMQPYAYVMYPAASTSTVPSAEEEVTEAVEGNIDPPARVEASSGTFADRIEVSWSSAKGALVYAVTRAEPGQDSFRFLGYSTGTTYTDRQIQTGVVYRYRIVVIGEEKTSDAGSSPVASGYASNASAEQSPGAIPEVRVTLDEKDSYRVNVSWTAVPGATHYQIRRWNAGGNHWQVWNQKISATQFTDPLPVKNAENRYSVRAGNTAGYGPWSDVVSVSVPGNRTPPNAPSGLVVSNGIYRDRIALRWNPAAGAEKYTIFRYDYSKKAWEGPIAETRSAEYVDSSDPVKDGRYYAYTVAALNASGASGYADPAVGRANPNVQRDGERIEAPTDIVAKLEPSGQLTITWKGVKGADEYYVLRKKRGEASYTFVGSTDAKTLRFTERFTGKPGELYLYTVRSKPMMGSESSDGKPAAVFVNAEIETVAHRFMPGQGLERMTGSWHGRYWDGRSAPRIFQLRVEGDGNQMTLHISDDRGAKATVKGLYPAMADTVVFKGVTLEYREDLKVLILRGSEGLPILDGKTISFTR